MESKSSDGPRKLAYEYLREITDNFSEDREIGRSAFAKVFKGLDNGEVFAVKKFYLIPPEVCRQAFLNEIDHLRRLEHPNIVRLVGFCNENQHVAVEYEGKFLFAESKQMALCYEYAPNGDLGKHLSGGYLEKNWPIRYKIIQGICEGLKYLHEGLEHPVLHLDLSPENILLDENMVPKISGFTTSSLLAKDDTMKTTSFIGKLGYVPPEYIQDGIISKKNDIWSLGVIIKRILITGFVRDDLDVDGSPPELIIEYWRSLLVIQSNSSLKKDLEQVKRCIEIALNCMDVDRRRRPTVKDIIRKLVEIETTSQGLSDDSRKLPYKSLLEISNDFNKESELGSGAFGQVFKFGGGAKNGSASDFPERLGQPVCKHYLKTGTCKYRSKCRFHHPKQDGSVQSAMLNNSGFPLRPV